MTETKTRRRHLIITGVAAVCIAVAAAIYFIFDPAESGFMPRCMFHQFTGLDCPGCGMQRMIHALLHGDFAAAWEANAFLLCALPWLVLMVAADLRRRHWQRLYAVVNSPAAIVVYSLLIVGWGLFRNLT